MCSEGAGYKEGAEGDASSGSGAAGTTVAENDESNTITVPLLPFQFAHDLGPPLTGDF